MHRTAEQRVDSFRRARALRAQGKPIWTRDIPMKAIINDGQGSEIEQIASKAVAIAALMRARLPAEFFDVTSDSYDWDFVDAIEDLEDYSRARLDALVSEGDNIKDMFNGSLNDIYDWADRERVWLG